MKKKNWREVLGNLGYLSGTKTIDRQKKLGGEPNIEFTRKEDGVYKLLVTQPNVSHPQPEVAEENNINQNDTLSPTPPQPGAITPSSPQDLTPTTSSKDCGSSSKDMKEWVIRKDGNLSLIGRECADKAGIFIINNNSSKFGKRASQTTIEQEVIEKKGRTWRELINQSVWEYRFEELVKNGK